MNFQTIRYMEWAKRTHEIEPVPFDLSASAVEHAPPEVIGSTAGLPIVGNNAYGHPGLRAVLSRRYGVGEDSVLCSIPGSSMANFLIGAAIVRAGDTVLVEWPCYEPLWRIFESFGARLEWMERRRKRFTLDLDRISTAFARGARLLVISNLMNPTGVLAETATIQAAGAIAARHGGFVLVDEVYLDGDFEADRDEWSAAAGGEQDGIIATSSLTKIFGLGGLRCGWAIAPPEVVERAYRVHDYLGVEQPYVADELALRAFERLPTLWERAEKRFRENLPIVRWWAEGRSDVDLVEPDGGFVAWVRLPEGWSSVTLEPILRARGAAVAPGHYFGAADHIRIGFGGPTEKLLEGLARLSRVLDLGPPEGRDPGPLARPADAVADARRDAIERAAK
jgi:aspartate/methionine/tyrosine aminotransferase